MGNSAPYPVNKLDTEHACRGYLAYKELTREKDRNMYETGARRAERFAHPYEGSWFFSSNNSESMTPDQQFASFDFMSNANSKDWRDEF